MRRIRINDAEGGDMFLWRNLTVEAMTVVLQKLAKAAQTQAERTPAPPRPNRTSE